MILLEFNVINFKVA